MQGLYNLDETELMSQSPFNIEQMLMAEEVLDMSMQHRNHNNPASQDQSKFYMTQILNN